MGAVHQRHQARVSSRPRAAATSFVLLFAAVVVFTLAVSAGQASATTARGILDWRLEMPGGISDLGAIEPIVAEMGSAGLNAAYTRVYFRWERLQPTGPVAGSTAAVRNTYDQTYLSELDAVIAAFHARGIRVILTGTDVPEWASDRRYWVGGVFDNDVVMAIDKPAGQDRLGRPGAVPGRPLQGQGRRALRGLERAQPRERHLSPALGSEEAAGRAGGVPQDAERLLHRRAPGQLPRRGHRRRHVPARRQRPAQHVAAVVRHLPQGPPGAPQRVLSPPLHAAGLLAGAERRAQGSHAGGHAGQHRRAAQDLPEEAVLPHRVRPEHGRHGPVLRHRHARRPGTLPAPGVRAHESPAADQGPALVPRQGLRPGPAERGRRVLRPGHSR